VGHLDVGRGRAVEILAAVGRGLRGGGWHVGASGQDDGEEERALHGGLA
jgi:hypothetical protein